MNLDLFEGCSGVVSEPFKDIRNQRSSVAEEKAALCLELNGLVKRIPAALNSASINRVRAWRSAREGALRTLNNKASSRGELQSAINTMRAYE